MTANGSVRMMQCTSCGTLAIGTGEATCCDSPMEHIDEEGQDRDDGSPNTGNSSSNTIADGDPESEDGECISPELHDILRTVFGMSPAELDICLCIMEGGPLTVSELSERVEYERSVVAQHLNHLVELDILKKRRQLLDRGGDVYVYSARPPEVVRERFRRSFLRWVFEATTQLDELSRRKIEGIAETQSNTEWTVFRHS